MAKFTLIAGDDAGCTITLRNTASGADGVVTSIEAGEKYEFEIDSLTQASLSTVHVMDNPIQHPVAASKVVDEETAKTKGGDLVDATDEDVKASLAELHANDGVKRTSKGYIDTGALNENLAAKGFNPVNAKQRDTLSDEGGFVKA